MKTINVLTLLLKLPDELCSEIIDFANYDYEEKEYEVYHWKYLYGDYEYIEERKIYASVEYEYIDNYDKIRALKSGWKQFCIFCDFFDRFEIEDAEIEDDRQYEYNEASKLKGICYI